MTRNRLFIIVTMLLVVFSAVKVYSVQNSAGVTTTPQSHIRGSVVDTSNTIDTNGNQIVTGNVRRGMHFRGNVPYTSPSSFNATLGSASLSSFMRDSAGAEDLSRTRNTTVASRAGTNYQSYYLPSSTVTTMSQGRSGIATTGNTTINNGSQYSTGSQTSKSQPAVSNWNTSDRSPTLWQLYNPGMAGTQNNTLSHPRSESSSQLPNQQQSQSRFEQYQQDDAVTYQLYRQQARTNPNATENLRYNSPYIENQTTVTGPQTDLPMHSSQQTAVPGTPYAEQINQWQQNQNTSRYGTQETVSSMTTEQSVPANMSRYLPPQRGYEKLATGEFDTTGNQTSFSAYSPGAFNRPVSDSVNTAYQPNTGLGPSGTQQYQEQINRYSTTQDTGTKESLTQIQRQLDDLIRSIDSRMQTPAVDTPGLGTTIQGTTDRPRTGSSYLPGQTNQELPGQTDGSFNRAPELFRSQSPQSYTAAPAEIRQSSQAEISAGTNHITDQYQDYESYSRSKYNQLYRAAEGHLNLGRFYQAADTFSLAAIYRPEDPLCYAGRGHALFAAGEYVSSALHLIRAIELDPEYLQTHIDLAELIGGPEKLDSKINDLNKWLQKSDAPGLGFLLGYVYYHTGRLNQAKQVMEVVTQEMPDSKAAKTLKMTIDFKLSIQK